MSNQDEKRVEQLKRVQDMRSAYVESVGYVARVLAQVTLPHSKPESNEFERTNGNVRIHMMAPAKVGLPYGTYPRLILAWIATEAKLTNSPELELGDNLSAFMRGLDLVPHGGRWGTITRLREQLERLMGTAISWTTYEANGKTLRNVIPVREAKLWWDPKRPAQSDLWKSSLRLDQEFFEGLVSKAVPVDMRALKALAHERSPLALDIYTWLTYRMSYLEAPTVIPWESLQGQFGGDFTRTRAFKEKFLERLKQVQELYPAARVRPLNETGRGARKGLLLEPSPTHVPKLVRVKPKALPSGKT